LGFSVVFSLLFGRNVDVLTPASLSPQLKQQIAAEVHLKSSGSYLHHILDGTNYLLRVSVGVDLAASQADETLKRTAVRSLEIIGEAVKGLA